MEMIFLFLNLKPPPFLNVNFSTALCFRHRSFQTGDFVKTLQNFPLAMPQLCSYMLHLLQTRPQTSHNVCQNLNSKTLTTVPNERKRHLREFQTTVTQICQCDDTILKRKRHLREFQTTVTQICQCDDTTLERKRHLQEFQTTVIQISRPGTPKRRQYATFGRHPPVWVKRAAIPPAAEKTPRRNRTHQSLDVAANETRSIPTRPIIG